MGIFEETQKFIEDHRPCGRIAGGVHPPTVGGYRVRMVCACGDKLDRWVTLEDAGHDLMYTSLLVLPN
jgi:hypothetical protein